MMSLQILKPFSLFIIIIFSLILNHCSCHFEKDSFNVSAARSNFWPAVATWYGDANGPGSGGGCGFANDVAGNTFKGLITAGNAALFKSGFGCGSCYQVRCTKSALCSGLPVVVTLTDECPGACNNEHIHFDLSGIAFGAMAKGGQGASLRKLGRIDIDYRRVPCSYRGVHITFKVDVGSNKNYLAFAIEYVSGDGTIGAVAVQPQGSNQWLPASHSWGETWKFNIFPGKTNPPFSIKLTTVETKRVIIARNVIPVNWAPGKSYTSTAS